MHCSMKDYELMEVQLHAFLPFALYGGEQLIHFLATSSPDKNVVMWTDKGAGLTPDLVQTLGRRKTSCPGGLISEICSPQPSHYTTCASPAHLGQLDDLPCMQFVKRQIGNAYERTSYFSVQSHNAPYHTIWKLQEYGISSKSLTSYITFYVYGSVHCKYTFVYIQQDATLHSLFISGNCSTCFRCYFHPSSGVHKTVSTASGICHTLTAACR